MLTALRVENYGIIQQAEITFEQGFTAVSGESGAGKTLLLTAIPAVLGLTGNADQVGPFAKAFRLRAAFTVSVSHPLWTSLRQWGIEDDEVLIVQRDMSKEGRSIYRVQGQIVPRQAVRELAAELIDYSGQHHALRLFESAALLAWLDHYGELDALRGDVDSAFQTWRNARAHLEDLQNEERRADTVADKQKELAELQNFALELDEEDRMTQELLRLHSRQQLLAGSQRLNRLLDDPEGPNLVSLVAQIAREVDNLQRLDAHAHSLGDLVQQTQSVTDEFRLTLSEWASTLEQEPGRMEEMEARASDLARLKRRYNMDVPELIRYTDGLRKQLQVWENLDWELELARRKAAQAENAYMAVAADLSAKRQSAAEDAGARLNDLTREMEMPQARLSFSVEPSDASPSGIDRAVVLFSSSASQELRVASKVASGGELARIALAMAVLSGVRGELTLVFDELDAGLGGKSAARVGTLLRELGGRRQVIVISHQPSVAAQAVNHWTVAKIAEDSLVRSVVKCVRGPEREAEIARMLSGHNDEVAIQHARYLLSGGGEGG